MTFLLAAIVVAGVAAGIGYPLIWPSPEPAAGPVGPAARLASLQERKAQTYAAIRELGFDYNTDKLEKDDYEQEVSLLKQEAVEIIKQIESERGHPPRADAAVEVEIAALRRRPAAGGGHAATQSPPGDATAAATFCTQCGAPAAPAHLFCGSCGARLGPAA